MICPICKSKKGKSTGQKKSFEIIKCRDCLTLYARKIENSADFFDYSNYYSEENLNIPDFVYETYRNVVREFETHRGNNRFLDVGCGAGTLLDIAKELNWDVTGVEVSKPAVIHLKEQGLNIFHGTLEEAGFPDDYFDAITCTEVIEHVPNPQEVLNEIARVLNPKGALWMTTPHGSGLSAKLLGPKWSVVSPPEHLNLFSVKSLRMCLKSAGFKNFQFALNGFNPFEVYQVMRGSTAGQTEQKTEKKAGENNKPPKKFNRVEKSYQLNKWFVGGKNKQKVKNLINSALSKTNLGDTIKVWATLE